MSTPALSARGGGRARLADERPLLPPAVARLLGFGALAAFAALHWAELVTPAAPGRMLLVVVVAVAAVAALSATASRPRAVRAALVAVTGVAAAAGALLAAGVPLRLLGPGRWGELASGLGQGIDGFARALVPYGGLDEWTRLVILLTGAALLALAAAGMSASGRAGRTVALVALGVLFALPTIQMTLSAQVARGAAFALLVAIFLWLERLRRDDAAAAALLVVGAIVLAVPAALALDARRPWADYRNWSITGSSARLPTFAWDHRYGPLDWPRTGREVLRVKARTGAYWKAENLDRFDGFRWRTEPTGLRFDPPTERRAEWLDTVTVVVRGLRSSAYIAPGQTLAIERSPRASTSPNPGVWATGTAPLRQGDSYRARVRAPRPAAGELAAAARLPYADELETYRTVTLPPPGASVRREREGPAAGTRVIFPAWGSGAQPLADYAGGLPARVTERDILASAYARTYELAGRLKAGARTPLDYVRRIDAYLRRGFVYDESPPLRALPLQSFLLRDRRGYCQHFSGAMALLLRMGGVPARVAAGFAPGSLDRKRGEYVVRDIDAHSWVEVWFPRIGWVPFDPTPTSAPPRSQAGADRGASAALADLRDRGAGDPVSGRGGGRRLARGGRSWTLPAAGLGILALLALAGGAVVVRQRRLPAPADPALAELERALRRSGRAPSPSTTLRALERRFGGAGEGAAAYLRALQAARFGRGAGPTGAERRALRRALGEGLGPAGRLRAWWALPPRSPWGGREPRRTASRGA